LSTSSGRIGKINEIGNILEIGSNILPYITGCTVLDIVDNTEKIPFPVKYIFHNGSFFPYPY